MFQTDAYVECPICLDLFQSPTVITPCCQTSSCFTCINACVEQNGTCPICRSNLVVQSEDKWIRNRQLEALCESIRTARYSAARANHECCSPCSPSSPVSPVNKSAKCVICLDINLSSSGMFCFPTSEDNPSHFICSSCFPNYVQSLCFDQSKLLDLGFEIRCPYPECCSKPYESSAVTSMLLRYNESSGKSNVAAIGSLVTADPHGTADSEAADSTKVAAGDSEGEEVQAENDYHDVFLQTSVNKTVLDQYISALVNAATRSLRMTKSAGTAGLLGSTADLTSSSPSAPHSEESLATNPLFFSQSSVMDMHRLGLLAEESLNIQCPESYCRAVLDPSPDGCCAMRCTHCGIYFCWLCLAVSSCSSNAHAHVRRCVENPHQGSVFISAKEMDDAQKQLRIAALRRALGTAHGSGWQKISKLRRIMRENNKIRSLLLNCNISITELFDMQIVTAQQKNANMLLASGRQDRRPASAIRRVLRIVGLVHPDPLAEAVGIEAALQDGRAWIIILAASCLIQYAGLDVFGLIGQIVAAATGVALSVLNVMIRYYMKLIGSLAEWAIEWGMIYTLRIATFVFKYAPVILSSVLELTLTSLWCIAVASLYVMCITLKGIAFLLGL